MVQRVIYVAATLLVVQLGLAIFLFSSKTSGLNEALPTASFVASFSPDKTTSIEISSADGKKLLLEKNGKGWTMPNAFSAPASTLQIETLLRKVAEAKQGLAVASSKGAAKRFKTAEEDFVRHLVFKAGGAVVADFYLGTSAGFRHSHARAAGKDEVTSIPISEFEAEAEADKWLDKSVAALNLNDLQAVVLGDIALSMKDKDWQLDGVAADQVPDGEIDKLLGKISGLSVLSVLDPQKSAPLFAQPPAVQFTITKKDGGKATYALAKQDDHYVLKMSDNALYFKIGAGQAEALAGMKREKLMAAKKTEVQGGVSSADSVLPIEDSANEQNSPNQHASVPTEAEKQETALQGSVPASDGAPEQNAAQNAVQDAPVLPEVEKQKAIPQGSLPASDGASEQNTSERKEAK